ncbi:hypothetical protein BH10PSE2_BH10PSE2_01760 [soil metagenome]
MTAAPLSALADASVPYYERSFVVAVDQKCRLFVPKLGSALSASAWQARGAAARAGVSDQALAETAERASAQAARTDCANPDLKIVQQRAASAFSGWSRLARMTFPGERAAWSANRSDFSSPTWRLMQASATGASPVNFGFVEGGDQPSVLTAVVSFVGKSRPYAARIVMRDAARAPWAWLKGRDPQTAGLPGGEGADLPPDTWRQTFMATGSDVAGLALLGSGQDQGQAWAFPTDAADALANLDPREPFLVEFLFRDDSVARARFEAGDFAAGRAFIAMGSL